MTFRSRTLRVLPSLSAIVLATGLTCATAWADTIYKSVDAEGNVTFSNTPPPPGVEAQQIELSPGPTPAQQQQSIQAEQNLEAQSDTIPEEDSGDTSAEQEDEPVVEPTTEYQEESVDSEDNDQPVVVDDGYVDDTDRNERLQDGVDDVKEVAPLPAEIHRPAGRVR